MTWKKPPYGCFNVSDAAGLKPIESFSSWWKFCSNVTAASASGLPYGCYLGFKEVSELTVELLHSSLAASSFHIAPINVFNDRQSCRGYIIQPVSEII